MTKWGDINSCDIEALRLKNRLRHQRYRAHKRVEKSRVGNRPVFAELFISSLPNGPNGVHFLNHDMGSLNPIEAKDGTRSGHEDIGKCDRVCSPIEVEPLQDTCIAQKEDKQQKQETHQYNFEFSGTDSAEKPYISPQDNHTVTSEKIHQISPQLEHSCENTLQMEYVSSVTPFDQREQCRIMARRLKNRERQRRYRARRRLEADMKKAHLVHHSTPPALGFQPSEITVNRAHCQRKWKEDARRVHATKTLELTSTEAQPRIVNFTNKLDTCRSHSDVKLEQPAESEMHTQQLIVLRDFVTSENTLGRRDWKEDARNRLD